MSGPSDSETYPESEMTWFSVPEPEYWYAMSESTLRSLLESAAAGDSVGDAMISVHDGADIDREIFYGRPLFARGI